MQGNGSFCRLLVGGNGETISLLTNGVRVSAVREAPDLMFGDSVCRDLDLLTALLKSLLALKAQGLGCGNGRPALFLGNRMLSHRRPARAGLGKKKRSGKKEQHGCREESNKASVSQ